MTATTDPKPTRRPIQARSASAGIPAPARKTRIVLSRRELERILIADGEIVIQIIRARRGAVRIAIEAPRHIRICREEIAVAAFARTREGEQRPDDR